MSRQPGLILAGLSSMHNKGPQASNNNIQNTEHAEATDYTDVSQLQKQ